MAVHDWTKVDAGLFHSFHQSWTVTLCNALNNSVLPSDYFALVERQIRGPIPDVLTLRLTPGDEEDGGKSGGIAVASAPPKARLIRRTDPNTYAGKANMVTVRHRHGDIVAVLEIVSPGNKGSRADFRTFVEKSASYIRQGVHLLVVDLFPPTKRDPQGIHKAIWDEFEEEELELPADKPLTVASYDASGRTAYVEFVGVGDALPNMPLFLKPDLYVPTPLDETYQEAWRAFPQALKNLLVT